jgi:hypothetical protein
VEVPSLNCFRLLCLFGRLDRQNQGILSIGSPDEPLLVRDFILVETGCLSSQKLRSGGEKEDGCTFSMGIRFDPFFV